jgi:hypothetical protein
LSLLQDTSAKTAPKAQPNRNRPRPRFLRVGGIKPHGSIDRRFITAKRFRPQPSKIEDDDEDEKDFSIVAA